MLFALLGANARADQGPPRRLVVGLDGLGFADVQAAQAAGAFRGFYPVSRMVSTFPSLSDIAWSEVFGIDPPPGYQRVYFELDKGRTVGGVLDGIRPIEFELRMHLGFAQKTHHLASYLSPRRTARGELAALERAFFESRGTDTFYAYLPAPDALQHVRGDVKQYLRWLDAELDRILERYRAAFGRELELALVSDHGNNGRVNAPLVDLAKFLREHGYHVGRTIAGPTDVAFNTDGVTTGLGIFAHPAAVEGLVRVLLDLRGVEVITSVDPAAPDRIQVVDPRGGVATIERRDGGDFAYRPSTGDPLGYAPLVAELSASGELDAAGYASPEAWFHVSREHEYPAALQRIWRGHHDVTQNPAPILVSMRDDYQLGNGLVTFLGRLRPLGGTHGGLNAVNSLGIVITNYRPTVDALSTDVARQFDNFPALPALSRRAARGHGRSVSTSQ